MATYTLRIRDANGNTRTEEFEASKVTVGRKKADILLDDASVSSRHGELIFQNDELTYVDVGSSNGSFDPSGGRIAAPFPMSEGMSVRLGSSRLELVSINIEHEVAERTSMLTADQLAQVLAAKRTADAGSAARSAPAPFDRNDSPPRSDTPAHRQPERYPDPAPRPEPARPAPARGGYPEESQSDGYDDMVPVSGGGWDDPPPAQKPLNLGKKAEAGGAPPPRGGGQSAPRPARPAPTGPLSDPPELDEAPAAAAQLIPEAIKESLELVKTWKSGPPVTGDDIKEALGGAWDLLAPNLTTATQPLLAISGATAILTLLTIWIPSLYSIFGILISILGFLSLFAYSATTLCLIGSRVGRPIDPVSAVKRLLVEPVPFLVSFLWAGLISFVGVLAVILPGIALGAFMWPAFWIEGRRNLGLNGRSLDLFRKDGRRIILVGLSYVAVVVVANLVLGAILRFVPFIGLYAAVLLSAVWSALQGAFGMALTLWMYFDIRAKMETGDAEAEARNQLA
ncbi:MAG: FHA domain-containing protein [Myxococcales bacterium]|nr:FHA domain-containing protein [Myxococcales bacterium]